MINFNKDSYGQEIRVNFGQSLVGATSLKMKFVPKSGQDIDVTATLGTSRVAVGDEYYEINEYLEYTVTDGMFDDYVGLWKKKGTVLLSGAGISTELELFRVTGQESIATRYPW